MTELTIKKDGIWVEIFDFENKKHIKRKIKSILDHLNNDCEIDKDVTLGDILNHLSLEKDIVSSVFSSFLGKFPFSLFLDDLNNSDEEKTLIKTLVLKRYFDTPFRKNGTMYSYVALYGIKSKNIKTRTTYSVSLTPLSLLKNMNIVLNPNIDIYKNKIINKKVSNPELILSAKTTYNLYEIISTILYEISFHGTKNDKIKFKEDLNKIISEIDYSKCIPAEKVFKDIRKKLKGKK
jgi:hypothetical protein